MLYGDLNFIQIKVDLKYSRSDSFTGIIKLCLNSSRPCVVFLFVQLVLTRLGLTLVSVRNLSRFTGFLVFTCRRKRIINYVIIAGFALIVELNRVVGLLSIPNGIEIVVAAVSILHLVSSYLRGIFTGPILGIVRAVPFDKVSCCAALSLCPAYECITSARRDRLTFADTVGIDSIVDF